MRSTAIAEEIGLSLALARRGVEQEIFSLSAKTALNYHEALKCCDMIAKEIEETKSNVGDEFLKRLYIKLGKVANILDDEERILNVEVGQDILKEIVENNNFEEYVKYGDGFSESYGINNRITEYFIPAIKELIYNAYSEVIKIPKAVVTLKMNQRSLGGTKYLMVTVANPVITMMSDMQASCLYRVPLLKERKHIGAFIAGSLIRGVGGDIYVRKNDKDGIITILEVPMKEVR